MSYYSLNAGDPAGCGDKAKRLAIAATHGALNTAENILDLIHNLTCLINCSCGSRMLLSILTEFAYDGVGCKALFKCIHIMQNSDNPQGCSVMKNFHESILLAALIATIVNTREIVKYAEFQKRVAEEARDCQRRGCRCCMATSPRVTSTTDPCATFISSFVPQCLQGDRFRSVLEGLSTILGTFTRGVFTAATTFSAWSLVQGLEEFEPCFSDSTPMYIVAVVCGLLLMPYKCIYLGLGTVKLGCAQVLILLYTIFKNIPLFGEKFGNIYLEIVQLQTKGENISEEIEKGSMYAILILISLSVLFVAHRGIYKQRPSLARVSGAEAAPLMGTPNIPQWKRVVRKLVAQLGAGSFAYFLGDSAAKMIAQNGDIVSPSEVSYDPFAYWSIMVLMTIIAFFVFYPRIAIGFK